MVAIDPNSPVGTVSAGQTAVTGTVPVTTPAVTKSGLNTGDQLVRSSYKLQPPVEKPGLIKRALKAVTDPVADALSNTAKTAMSIGKATDLVQATGAHNPRFKYLQEMGDHKFVRVLHEPEPWVGKKLLDRLWWGGSIAYVDPAAPTQQVKHVDGVVWNEDTDDVKTVRGDVNLTYEDPQLGKKFESKLFEARFIQKYAPDAIAKTESLGDIVKELKLSPPKTPKQQEAYLKAIQNELHRRYGDGFILKGAFDANTGGNMPTNKSDFVALYSGYREEYLPYEAAMKNHLEGTELINKLRGHDFKGGDVLDQLIKNPNRVIVQEKLKLARWTNEELPKDVQPFQEIRVHMLDGKVVPGASSHRWSIGTTINQQQLMQKAEAYVQDLFDKFPRQVTRKLSFAPDVAMLQDGSFRVIELNVGGVSGFLYRNPMAAQAIAEAATGKELLANRLIRPVASAVSKSSKFAGQVFQRAAQTVRVPD